ncbi:MAG: phosphatase PAP2 family protein [Betaproteobacteria bacterium]
MPSRYSKAGAFMRARLASTGLFGLYFTVGTIVLAWAIWVFGGISEDLITGDPLVFVDALISEWLRTHADPGFARGMQRASALASASTVGILSALIACGLMWKRLWYSLLGLALVVTGGILLNILLKNLFGRARPGWADPLMALTDPGFPSGHTMMATILYGYVAVFLIWRIAAWRWRFFIGALTIVLVLAVALSRMYLGAHYLSDVMGAMAAGTAWLALCLTAVEAWRRHRMSLSRGPA